MADEDGAPTDAPAPPPTEVVEVRVEFDLVPEWSNVVEKIGNYYGEKVDVGFQGKDLIVKITIKTSEKERMKYDLDKTWDYFVETKKREGKWRRPGH